MTDDLYLITLECQDTLSFKRFCQLLDKESKLSEDDKMKLFALVHIVEDGVLNRYSGSIDSVFLPGSKGRLSFYPLKTKDSVTIKGNREESYKRSPASSLSKNTVLVISCDVGDKEQNLE